MNLLTSLLALTALAATLVIVLGRFEFIQDARQKSAHDTCQILQALIVSSAAKAGQVRQGAEFLRENGLVHCGKYALRVRRGSS